MEDFVGIGKMCRLMGISLSTAYRRIKAGTLAPAFRTSGGHRRFASARQIRVEAAAAEKSFEQELAVDVIELMTVFCARLYGKRSHRNKQNIGGTISLLC